MFVREICENYVENWENRSFMLDFGENLDKFKKKANEFSRKVLILSFFFEKKTESFFWKLLKKL